MVELARAVLADEEAWLVGGALRDELLGRPVVDLDVACRRPEEAARAYARRVGGAPFPLSEQHGAWRVALADGRTVDFTPLRGTIEADLATRDFTVNALARPLAGGEIVDTSGGLEDVTLRSLRAVTETVFEDDPLRLLRAVRLEDELGFRLAPLTEELVRTHAELAPRPAGERILAELERLSPAGFRRLDELGLLAPLGGTLERGDLLEAFDSPDFRLAVVFGPELRRYPMSNERKRLLRALLRAERPPDASARAIHRFRRATEPWALEALAYVGARELAPAVESLRAADPDEPLLRGDELGLPPGPAIGRLLELVEEERAAGIISTREEALELVRREVAKHE
jgi:tRNA nucleotidyltransferase/poly(A) polymerase